MASEGKIENRPWGKFIVLDEGLNYKVKRLEIKVGQRISLQSHEHRNEFWSVVSGFGLVVLGDKEIHVHEGDTVQVFKGIKHRVAALPKEDLIIIEVQHGVCDETDIKRFDDDYERE